MFLSFIYGGYDFFPPFFTLRICIQLTDIYLCDVVCYSDIMMLSETAIGKNEHTVLVSGKYVFRRVVDGMCQ